MSERGVLFLGHGAERTGPPVYLLRMLRWLEQEHPDHDMPVAVVLLEGGPLLDEFRSLAPTWVIDPQDTAARAGNPPGDPPDFQLTYVNTAGSVRAMPQLPHPPGTVVTHVHELSVGLDYYLDRDHRFAAIDDAAHLWAVADAVAQHLQATYGRPGDQIRIHRGVIDQDPLRRGSEGPKADAASLGIPAGAPVIGASGTLDWRKAPDHFIELARLVPAAHFVWIGGDPSGEFAQATMAGAKQMGVAGRVHFIEEQADPTPWFRLLDLFVLPSREDAYPLVVLEVAAVGVPTICFDTGGAQEFVRGDAGIVTPYPDLQAFAENISALLADPVRRAALGQVAMHRALTDHVPDAAGPRWAADLIELLDGTRG